MITVLYIIKKKLKKQTNKKQKQKTKTKNKTKTKTLKNLLAYQATSSESYTPLVHHFG